MREFLQSWRFKVIICILALLVGFMVYAATSGAGGTSSFPETLLRTVTAPFARLSTTISTFVESNLDMFVNARQYRDENEELRQTISELNKRIVDIDELRNQNELLREMLEISNTNPDFVWPDNTCTVISRDALDPSGGFTVNRGSDNGISPFDLVITRLGVVGIVTETAPNLSRVSTVLSNDTEIGVLTTRGSVKGIIQNDILYARDGLIRVSYIEKDADIQEGDMFVTIGSDMYPGNQIVGTVVQVYEDSNGMSRHALVEPAVDVFRLTNVLVVTDFEGRVSINAE